MKDVVEGLVRAVNSGRTDVVRSVIVACQTAHESEESSASLKQLLNSPITKEGTVLHLACRVGQADIVRALLAAGADTCVQNADHHTALELTGSELVRQAFNEQLLQCVAQSDVGRVCQLLAAGVSVNLRDSQLSLNTPLHWAATYGSQEVLAALCDRGAEVVAANHSGATPLHDAVLRAHIGIVDTLLTYGAGASIHTRAHDNTKYTGKTPLELAETIGGEIHKTLIASEQTMDRGIEPQANGDVLHGNDSASLIANVPPDFNRTNSQVTKDSAFSSNPPQQHAPPSTTKSSANSAPTSPGQVPAQGLLGDFAALDLGKDEGIAANGENSQSTAHPALEYLWPRPQILTEKSGKPFPINEHLLVFVYAHTDSESVHKSLDLWRHYGPAFYGLGLKLQLESLPRGLNILTPHILCDINRAMFSRENSYRLSVSQDQVRIQASGQAGLRHAISTLLQLLRFSQPNGIPPVQILDWPSVTCRGVLLDVSKGRVPHLEVLKNYICIFSQLKISQLQLYTRARVPKDNEARWQFPYPRSALLELERFASSFGIELVPVLDIAPHVTLSDLEELYHVFHNLLVCFVNAKLVGIGPRLTNLLTDISEDGYLSLDDAHRFIPCMPHQALQICAYAFHSATHVLPQLPCGTMLAEYGFTANYDFHSRCKTYDENGVPYCLVAGSAAWNSLAGCPEGAVTNIHNAVQTACQHHSLGVLLSHWSGLNHVTSQSMMWPAVVAIAGLAWNSSISKEYMEQHVAELTNKHVVGDQVATIGQVIVELGRVETSLLKSSRNQPGDDSADLPAERGSTLHQLLTHPDSLDIQHLTIDHFQKTMRHIRRCQNELCKVDPSAVGWANVVAELSVTADLMLTACRLGRQLVAAGKKPGGAPGVATINPGVANLTPTAKTDLANRLLAQIEAYKEVWLAANLPEGLAESTAALSHTLNQCVPQTPAAS